MDRREWLVGTASAAGAGIGRALSPAPAGEFIDCHTHFYDPAKPGGVPWPGKGTSLYRTVLPRHLRELRQHRKVTGTVVVEASPLVEDNDWLLNLAREDPFIVGVVGNLNPDDPRFAANARRLSANPLFRGIRVSSSLLRGDIPESRLKAFALLADLDLALDVNGGPETPGLLPALARRLPGLRIVLNHIGNVEITRGAPPEDWAGGIRAAARHPRVWCKVSALVEGAARKGGRAPTDKALYQPYLDIVWNAFGNERVIYGSDWPVCENAADYETMQRLVVDYADALGAQAARQFGALNAKAAYKWVDRPGRV